MTISKERFRELLELQESGDDTIDYSDIPELDDDFWKNATYRDSPIDSLIKRVKSVDETLSLSVESVEFFRLKANQANVSYEKLIRLAIDDYVTQLA